MSDEMQVLNNINKHSFETLYDLAKIMVDIVEDSGFQLFASEDEFYLEEVVHYTTEPLSAECKSIIKSEHTKERSFMINVLGYMTTTLYYSSPNYQEMYYEMETDNNESIHGDEITEEEYELNEIMLNEALEDLNSFEQSLPTVNSNDVQSSFNVIRNNEPYKELMRLINLIDNKPITLFVNPYAEEAEFTNSMRIEYDFDNLLTERYIDSLDDHINNDGIGNPCILTKLGFINNSKEEFKPYLLLIKELNKVIENEFT